MEEDWDRLNHAIDRRFQIEDAFIQAMTQEFQRIQQELNKCIARHPDDPQLARVGEDFGQFGVHIVPYKIHAPVGRLPLAGSLRKAGGKRTRRR